MADITASPMSVTRGVTPTSFLELRDLRIHFPTDDGLVRAVDPVRSALSAAEPSASSASPAPVSR